MTVELELSRSKGQEQTKRCRELLNHFKQKKYLVIQSYKNKTKSKKNAKSL